MLLKGATVATLDPPLVERADLRVEGRPHRGAAARRSPLGAGEEVLDLAGAVVLPGLVNAHTHLYSALARGMPGPRVAPRSFVEVLERVWWRLDRALDAESVYLSGLVGAIEAALSGTTLLIDHHSSPSFIRGLAGRAAAGARGGGAALGALLRGDRPQRDRRAGISAWTRTRPSSPYRSPLTRGMIGGHASFTLSPESLDAAARRSCQRTGAASTSTSPRTRSTSRTAGPATAWALVERLDAHGLLVGAHAARALRAPRRKRRWPRPTPAGAGSRTTRART